MTVVLVISSLVFGSYWFIKNRQKGSADINIPPDIETALKARIMAAGAWIGSPGDSAKRDKNTFYVLFRSSVISIIAKSAESAIFPDLEDDCFKQFSEQYLPKDIGNARTIIITPPNQIGSCEYSLKKFKNGSGYDVNVSYQIYNVIVGNFDKIYKFSLKDNFATDNIRIQYEANSRANYSMGYNKNKWVKTGAVIQNFTGTVDGPYKLYMDGFDDLKDQLYSKILNDGFRIDTTKSNWNVKTTGNLVGKIKGSWNWDSKAYENDYYKIDELEFCLNQDDCKITIEETLNLFADKIKKNSDDSYGTIESHAYHKETNTGTGKALKDELGDFTGQVAWDTLVNDKTDDRSWKQTLTFDDKIHVGFDGFQNSTAHVEPKTDSITAETKYQKNFSIDEPTLHPNNPSVPNYKTTRKRMDRTDINNNNTITRSGSGSSKIEAFDANGSNDVTIEDIKGVYDNIDELLKITEPANRAGERIDFWQNVNAEYIKTYFPAGTAYVPGMFTATDGNAKKTIISTPPYKGVPKEIVIMLSYIPGDKAFPSDYITKIYDFILQLDKRGANTVTKMNLSKKEMLNSFSQIPSGSMVINIGHGDATRLMAGNDSVSYKEIQKVLKNKQVKISTFAAYSCYAGRMPTAIASDIIASMGVGAASFDSNNIGSLIGFSNNYWNASVDDIINQLSLITGCST